jgi:SAM-dependent methyltransferase
LSWVQYQADEHPLVPVEPVTKEEYVGHLMHQAAYHIAAAQADGLRVIDIGCNNGHGTAIIAERCASIIGVDVSRAAIREALLQHSAANTEFLEVDGSGLPFESSSFDLATGFQVIEHVDDVPRFLTEINRVLKHGGRALFTTPNGAIRLNPGMSPWNPFHIREYTSVELHRELSQVFAHVAIRGLTAPNEVHELEVRRVERAKHDQLRSRTAILPRIKHRIGEALPTTMVDLLQSVIHRSGGLARPEPDLPEFMSQHTARDLEYGDDLDSALDFMAICSKARSAP